MKQVVPAEPARYERHAIHGEGRIWAETNCYVDLWIELLHALGCDPVAALPFTVAIDFEGDQWTFFKFPLRDLYELYGIDVQELMIWRPLVTHVEEQVDRGRPVLVELDSFYLPDTAGSAYRLAHVKTTVAVTGIDAESGTLRYFHAQGFHQLERDDFRLALHVDDPDAARLPPYVEIAKVRDRRPGAASLVEGSLALLKRHLELVPDENPFVAFRERLRADLAALLDADLETFHQYSFATLRQCGACYELAATYLQWLIAAGHSGLEREVREFQCLSESAKRLQFQLARAMARRTPLDVSPLDEMAEGWTRGTSALQERFA